jgi:transcriptional regulator with PAS, ATPase and Fis domain
VVIYGESGTGKELIARTIHNMSEHHNKSFVPVNCEAIPETLFESEFFGHRKAAFAGAYGAKHGFFALCHEGVLFLDKVNELSLSMQVKLIGAIEGSGYTPVGDNKFRNADVRIIAATTRNLADMVKKGLMREDFFYRIYIIPITVPPLRDRKEDIPLLVDHFLNFHHRGNNPSKIPEKIIETLYDHDWPGNVRELQNVLKRYIAIKRLDLTGAQKTRPVDMCNVSAAELDKEDVELHGAQETFEKNFDCPYPESESLAQS